MSEGELIFGATHAPAHWDDPMMHVLLHVRMSQIGSERGVVIIEKEVTPNEARAYAAEIIKACEVVEGDV